MGVTATVQVAGLSAGLGKPTGALVLRVEGDGPDAGREVVIAKTALIGSDPACALVLNDKAVSRKHAEVKPARGGVYVADLGSTNGTRIGGARVLEGFVATGSELIIGETRLRVLDAAVPRLPPSSRSRFGGLIGVSRVMREVFAVLEAASPTDATILLEGPSGTGKELAARAVHDHSPRAGGPFVAFDAGSTSRDLMQASLMGHKKGAFTGAVSERAGAFLEANGGTLFLDELGELPLESQAHLLRVLEVGEVVPVGGDKPRKVDVRVVAATNRDLDEMVRAGTFRLDLFHRLAVVHIRLPPLRDRVEDIPAIVRGFYEERGIEPGDISGDNLERLRAHSFDGNVRELKNILERSLVLAPAKQFSALKLWLGASSTTLSAQSAAQQAAAAADASLPFAQAKERVIERFEADYLADLMARFDGNISRAARHADLSRRHLRVLLVKHGLVPSAVGQATADDDVDE